MARVVQSPIKLTQEFNIEFQFEFCNFAVNFSPLFSVLQKNTELNEL